MSYIGRLAIPSILVSSRPTLPDSALAPRPHRTNRKEKCGRPVTAVTEADLSPATIWPSAARVSGITEMRRAKPHIQGLVSNRQAHRDSEAKMSWNMLADATVEATHVGASFVVAMLLGMPFFLAVAALLTGLYSA
jgi:hypothetical protein